MKKLTWLMVFLFMVVAGYSWATVNITTSRIQYSCNGSTSTFTYPFKIYEDDDLDAFITDTSDVETTLILNTEYTVSDAGDDAGGTVMLAAGATCPSGFTLTFLRDIDITQDTDYVNGQRILPDELESPSDKSRIIDQQMLEDADRSLKVVKASTLIDLTVVPAADKAIFFNSAGTGLETRALGSTPLAIPADESVTAAKLNTADVTAINAKLGLSWLSGAYIIVGSVSGADYTSLAQYLADAPAAGDYVIITEDQTVITQTVIPDDITLELSDGTRLLSSTGLATSTLKLGSNTIIRGVLSVFLNHTGTIAKAVEFSGDNVIGNLTIENSSTGTITDAIALDSGAEGNICSLIVTNTGAGTITTIYDNSSDNETNIILVSDQVNDQTTGSLDIFVTIPFLIELGFDTLKDFDISAQEGTPTGLAFSYDGTKMYVVGSGNNTVYQYTLSTAWDVSTAVYASKSKDVSAEGAGVTGVDFSVDGTNMYTVNITNDAVYQYTLSTAWDVSTAIYASKSLDVSSEDISPSDLAFNVGGTTIYVVGNNNNTIYQYAVPTAWDVSTAVYANKSKDVSAEEVTPNGVAISNDGKKLFMVGGTNSTAYEYILSTAGDISTASSTGKTLVAKNGQLSTVAFSTEGTQIYFLGNSIDTVQQYNTNVVVSK